MRYSYPELHAWMHTQESAEAKLLLKFNLDSSEIPPLLDHLGVTCVKVKCKYPTYALARSLKVPFPLHVHQVCVLFCLRMCVCTFTGDVERLTSHSSHVIYKSLLMRLMSLIVLVRQRRVIR